MPNMGLIINKHNRELISREENPNSTPLQEVATVETRSNAPLMVNVYS